MTYTYIVNPETGEILFDLVHDLITQNIRAIKLIAKKLNAVLRQKGEVLNKEIEKLANNYKEIINKTSDLALKQNDGDIRKARKWLKEQLFYTADRATNELIKLSIDNILDYHGVSSNRKESEMSNNNFHVIYYFKDEKVKVPIAVSSSNDLSNIIFPQKYFVDMLKEKTPANAEIFINVINVGTYLLFQNE